MSVPHTPDNSIFLSAYDTYGNDIFRFCLSRIKNRDQALDLTQETFIRAWQYLEKGNSVENMRAFLYRVARNLIVDTTRRHTDLSLDMILDEGELGAAHATIDNPVLRDDMSHVLQALELLSHENRDLITLRYLDGLSIQEIAHMTGKEPNTVSVRIKRILAQLRIFLEEGRRE